MTVTLTVRVSDAAGNETVQTHSFEASGAAPLSGDVSGVYGDAHIVGDVNLTGDLIIEGLLTGVDTFTLNGNGFQLLFQHGGRPNLAGVEKTAWMRWGDSPVGWQVGDRVAVAPTAVGVYVPSEILWGAARPANSLDVTLVDGSVARPEIVNLTQTIVLKNLRRIHFHEGAGVASLKWLRVLDSGTFGVLSDYPLHFHLNGDSSRGSVLEGVVVEGGKNHAFVPHGSHGITLRGCVAYNTIDHAYWWDPPIGNDLANNSDDSDWDGILALWVKGNESGLTGISLGEGVGNRLVDSAASCVQGGNRASGIKWPEPLDGVWVSERMTVHNNKSLGVFVWQNGPTPDHHVLDLTTYNNGLRGVLHGAYRNIYHYQNVVSHETVNALSSHALPTPNAGDRILFEDWVTNATLEIAKHNNVSPNPVIYRRCLFTAVIVRETFDGGVNPGKHRFEDCGTWCVPAAFDMTGALSGSVFEIYTNGVLQHRWTSGVWS